MKFSPPISRVHKLFRLRIIVNEITKLNQRGDYPVNDEKIAVALRNAGLSKFKDERKQHRIERRARDHLLTATYLGLLTRIGRPFSYEPTRMGKKLLSYGQEECPKNANEESIFIDRLMTLKLTNVYDQQTKKQYQSFRSRPCLFLLHILKKANFMHEHQLAICLGSKCNHPYFMDKETKVLIKKIFPYSNSKDRIKQLNVFYQNFHISKEDKKNMTRNIRPILDWCIQVGLISSKSKDETKWFQITKRGLGVYDIYKKKLPLWFLDLENLASIKAAILLFYKYAKAHNIDVSKFLTVKMSTNFSSFQIVKIVQDLEKLGIKFSPNYQTLENDIDFTLDYDIPPDQREHVLKHLNVLKKISPNLNPRDIGEFSDDNELKDLLNDENLEIKKDLTPEIARDSFIPPTDPLFNEIKESIPSVGILNQYRNPFEKEVSIFLNVLKFNSSKYQGQLAIKCSKRYAINFFENNPDIIIKNGLECLVECKSTNEWKNIDTIGKQVPKEIITYNNLLSEVKSNSIIIVYEGRLSKKATNYIKDLLNDCKNIIFINKDYLINAISTPIMKKKIEKVMKKPNEFTCEERILVS